MTSRVLIRTGHGYEEHSTQGRCTAFDGFDIVAAPLHQDGDGWQAAFGDKARESRIYRRASGNGTDYGSHAIKLAREAGSAKGDLAALIIALPERLQYALLYSIYKTASEARTQAQAETRQEWAQAIADGRIRKRRATKTHGGRVEIVPQWEVDLKAGQVTA